MSPLKAIPTRYHGYHFQSRLEARWAVFFDALGIRYDYEPEGFILPNDTCYLPDFWLPDAHTWAEVKPNDRADVVAVPDEALRRLGALAVGTNHAAILLDGPPRDTNYWAAYPDQMDPVGWNWEDVYLADGYYKGERGRLYVSTGSAYFPAHAPEGTIFGEVNSPGIAAARAARFGRAGA